MTDWAFEGRPYDQISYDQTEPVVPYYDAGWYYDGATTVWILES